jgi:PD-(D/E)XK nuclease superfamily protein
MNQRQQISISETSNWLTCRVKHDFRYNKRLVPRDERLPLTRGKAVHIGLEYYYLTGDRATAIKKSCDYLSRSTLKEELIPLVKGMLSGYFGYYGSRDADDFEVLHVELPFKVPLISPSGRASRIFDLVGRVDMIVQKPDGSYWIVEHKTVGMKDKNYFRRLESDFQVRSYTWAVSRFLGVQVKGVIYNALRTKIPVEPEVLKSGKISKRANIDTNLEVFEAALQKTGSNPADYADILDRLRQEGNTFYNRVEYELPPDDLNHWAMEMYHLTREMRVSKMLYRNPTACANFGGCEYRDLCSSTLPEDEVSSRYRCLSSRHPELADVDLDSLQPCAGKKSNQQTTRASDQFIASLMNGETANSHK